MFKNYIKIAFRNLIKNKSHLVINVGGLALGALSAIIIFLIIQYQMRFDTWHRDSDRIYRVVRHDTEFGRSNYGPGIPNPMPEAIRNDISGIESVAVVDGNFSTPVIMTQNQSGQPVKFKVEDAAFVNQEYFDLMSYTWLKGDPKTALEKPNSVVLTQSLAEKLFSSLSSAIGQTITFQIGNEYDLNVTGIVEDFSETTHFPFNIMVSLHSKSISGNQRLDNNWGGTATTFQSYIKLTEGVKAKEINRQFDPLIAKYRNEDRATKVDYFLQPLSNLHFDTRFETFGADTISKQMVFALGLIGLLLLITACINFINLTTAVSVNRAREVGLRKTMGSTRSQLTLYFLAETALVVLVSLIMAVAFTDIALAGLESILGYKPDFNLYKNPLLLGFLILQFVIITVGAGWYPSYKLSSYEPIEAIRSKVKAQYGKGLNLRRALIVVQFSITQILVICAVVIASQMDYFQQRDMGIVKQAVVEVPIPTSTQSSLQTFKNSLKSQSSIKSITFSNTGTANGNIWGGNFVFYDENGEYEDNGQIKFIDPQFLETYGLKLVAGRNVIPSDSVTQYLVNETFAAKVGYKNRYEDLIGKTAEMWGDPAPIVGVVKDFNTSSLHDPIKPLMLTTRPIVQLAGIKIETAQTSQAIDAIRKSYTSVFPDYVFEYEFLDDKIASFYQQEQQTARLMNICTVVAIIIGCLGLFGLISFMTATRTKEIGIRKVLGATATHIIALFGRELALLLGISFIIAAPVGWFAMQNWLSDFAYRISLNGKIFMLTLLATVIIAVLTAGYKTLRAAYSNPVNSLRSEN